MFPVLIKPFGSRNARSLTLLTRKACSTSATEPALDFPKLERPASEALDAPAAAIFGPALPTVAEELAEGAVVANKLAHDDGALTGGGAGADWAVSCCDSSITTCFASVGAASPCRVALSPTVSLPSLLAGSTFALGLASLGLALALGKAGIRGMIGIAARGTGGLEALVGVTLVAADVLGG